MGASPSADAVRCCQEERFNPRCPVELDTDCAASHADATSSCVHQLHCELPQHGGEPGFFQSAHYRQGQQWGCCRAAAESSHEPTADKVTVDALEALSYMPVRFDADPTIDVERSHTRYSKIVVHSSRARTQKRSKAWEDWLRAAVLGRTITLLTRLPQDGLQEADANSAVVAKVSATYYLDQNLTKFSIVPVPDTALTCIPILVDSIQVICPATDFMFFFDKVEEALSDSEKQRAVLVEYISGERDRKRVCFLEESDSAKDHFVQALTSLWLEKRNDHSMWF